MQSHPVPLPGVYEGEEATRVLRMLAQANDFVQVRDDVFAVTARLRRVPGLLQGYYAVNTTAVMRDWLPENTSTRSLGEAHFTDEHVRQVEVSRAFAALDGTVAHILLCRKEAE
jgi:hypothetical protein